MNTWRDYWQSYGIRYGAFQAFMVTAWVLSGIGMVAGLAVLAWPA